MNSFIFSRRFLIPLLLSWLLMISYYYWEFWRLYRGDLSGKGFPFSMKFELIFNMIANRILLICFLSAFVISIGFWYHRRLKSNSVNPFSFKQLFPVVIISFACFLFAAIGEPHILRKNRSMLTNMVFSKNLEDYEKFIIKAEEFSIVQPRMLTWSELLKKRKESSAEILEESRATDGIFRSGNVSRKESLDFEFYRRIALFPASLVFYIVGIMVAILFRRTFGVFVLVTGLVLTLFVWNVLLNIGERLFHRQQLNAFWAAFLPVTILILCTGISLFAAVRKRAFHTENPEELAFDEPV